MRTGMLFTLGYEGQTLEEFLQRLADTRIETVIDVRELPLSRKRGFSKRALAEKLAERGIGYLHMQALGCPKLVRDRLKLDGDWTRYVRDFERHLSQQTESVREVASLARETSCGLLCFEADFERCHRSLVGRAVAAIGGPELAHITPTTVIPDGQRSA